MPIDVPAVNILIVDDDRAICEYMQTLLERDGYQVKTLGDPTTVEEEVRTGGYHLILLDVMMPKLDGLGVVDELRKNNSPVLAHTYLLTAGDLKGFDDLPVRGVIGKPFDIRDLLAETKD